MTVILGPELEKWLQEQVESGEGESVSEVVEKIIQQARLTELKEKLLTGAEQLRQGKGIAFTKELVKDIQHRGREIQKQ